MLVPYYIKFDYRDRAEFLDLSTPFFEHIIKLGCKDIMSAGPMHKSISLYSKLIYVDVSPEDYVVLCLKFGNMVPDVLPKAWYNECDDPKFYNLY